MGESDAMHDLRFSDDAETVTARIGEYGAAILAADVGGMKIVQEATERFETASAVGRVLVPWPNRIAFGRWLLGGEQQQLLVTDPERRHALHGLLLRTRYSLMSRSEHSIRLAASIEKAPGYPFCLDTEVEYSLSRRGITSTHTLVNTSDIRAPVGLGAHPFLRVGDHPIDTVSLRIGAGSRLRTDDFGIPTSDELLVGTKWDLRRPVQVGARAFDHTYGRLERAGGRVAATLEAPDGSVTRIWGDEAYHFFQVFTTESFPSPAGPVPAIAIEPMTCAPDAFNNGWGLRWLEPRERWITRWGIEYHPSPGR